MGIYLSCRELLMTENVLQDADIDLARLIHQRRRRVAQLMHGIVAIPQSRFAEMLFHKVLHRFRRDALTEPRDKERILCGILPQKDISLREICLYRLTASLIQIDHSLLVSLSDHP